MTQPAKLSTSQLLDLYTHHAAEVLPERFSADRCLNAARVTVEVMKRCSLGAVPMSVHAMAMNGVYADKLRNMGREPGKADVEDWARVGGWIVKIHTEAEPEKGRWPGHLVCLVGKEFLVDAASGQFNRPERRLEVPEVFVGGVTPRWIKGKEGANFSGPDGSVLCYRARVGEASWMKQPGWQASVHNLEAADEIFRRMRA